MLEIVLVLIAIVILCYKTKKNLHILQLNLYNENNRYIKWVFNNSSNFFSLEILGLLLISLANHNFPKNTPRSSSFTGFGAYHFVKQSGTRFLFGHRLYIHLFSASGCPMDVSAEKEPSSKGICRGSTVSIWALSSPPPGLAGIPRRPAPSFSLPAGLHSSYKTPSRSPYTPG